MLLRTIAKFTLLTAVVFVCVSPTEASIFNFFFGGMIDTLWKGSKSVVTSISHTALGGATGIVYDAINLNYFGIGPRLRKWFGIAVEKGGTAALDGSWYLFTTTISKLFGLVKDMVKKMLNGLWKLKTDIAYSAVKFFIPVIKIDDVDFDVQIDVDVDKTRSIRSAGPVVQVLRGRRESGTQYDILKDTFGSATLNDRMQCLPMILCAIYADPDDFVTPLESKFKKAFRSLFREKYSPVWASQYVRAADIGESSMSAAACQATYPSCTFSPSHLRSLISQAMDIQWYKKNSNEVKT